jgi:hypothetical protein
MLHQGARAAVLGLFLLACGGNTPSTGPDGGTSGAGGSNGSGGDGAAGKGGNPGDGGQGPYVKGLGNDQITKIDILFMIDNSSSMADKQAILADAVPELVSRLVDPKCVDPVTGRVVGPAVNGVCSSGVVEFPPLRDIHIGVLSSSLGNHGSSGVCEDAIDASLGRSDPHNNDQAHLVNRGSGGVATPTYQDKGFLFYNPAVPGALSTAIAVFTVFTEMVRGVGQHGCGYEASLESVYRFLVDPDPYATIRIDTSGGGYGQALLNGTDKTLLEQRKNFLRPDSLVSIVIVSDENDCSIVDGGQGFYPILPPVPGTGRSVLKPGTSKCKDNPNDPCCFNCGLVQPPPGCAPAATDPDCQAGELAVKDDQPNLRCYEQKRRYGADFLYPVQRYIDGFSKAKVPNRKGEMVDNPLFSDLTCAPNVPCGQRDPSLVFVTGIVGVPWQDIAVDPSNLSLGYKTARQMDQDGTWASIVGDPESAGGPVPPHDIHMIESIRPRNGLPGPGSAPNADARHGHEWDPSKDSAQPNADLQYACTFDLVPPRTCVDSADCDCFGPDIAATMNPLCQNAQGAYTTTQLRGKAYPGGRILQVLRGIGDQAVVSSICPAQTTNKTQDDFGYSPAVRAVLSKLRVGLGAKCLPVALPVDAMSGSTPCAVIEAFTTASCHCDNEPGRRTAPDALVIDEARSLGNCFCEIMQTTGMAQSICRTDGNPSATSGDGWCYVDPAQFGDAACGLVSACPADQQRKIRFMNIGSEPRPGAVTYLTCNAQPVAPLPPICP